MTKMFLQRTMHTEIKIIAKLKAGKEAMDMRGVIAVTVHNFLKKC